MPRRATSSRSACKGCGISFIPKTKKQKYHSARCRKEYYKEHYFIQIVVSKSCPNCGTTFTTTKSKKQTYCTPDCREDARKKRMEGLSASATAERVTYLGERMAAFERDGFKCSVCGRGIKDSAVLDTVEEGAGLVTVCVDCKAGKEIKDGSHRKSVTQVGKRTRKTNLVH